MACRRLATAGMSLAGVIKRGVRVRKRLHRVGNTPSSFPRMQPTQHRKMRKRSEQEIAKCGKSRRSVSYPTSAARRLACPNAGFAGRSGGIPSGRRSQVVQSGCPGRHPAALPVKRKRNE